ncbi:MAG: YlmC/YmxH family sporulation protein [Firmicutes bacterium]|nr:YlmC/YmxH family sporulation protein [Bacillota bacterium]
MHNKMGGHGNFSFAELRAKEVVNSIDGKRLGRIIDVVFGCFDGRIMGLVLPHTRKNIIFKNSEPIFIPWDYVERVGEDIIMVKLFMDGSPIIAHRPGVPHRHENTQGVHTHSVEEHPMGGVGALQPQPKYQESEQEQKQLKRQGADNAKVATCDNQCEKCMLFDCDQRWQNGNSLSDRAKSLSEAREQEDYYQKKGRVDDRY